MWGKMLDSSVWRQKSKGTRLVWVTMLMMKDAEGIVRAGVPGITDRARVSRKECEKALKELSEPDEDTMTQENEGRRIEKVAEGWKVLNHEKYRTSEDIREKWRRQKANQRANEAAKEMADEEAEIRRSSVKEKIEREEAIEARVRAKCNAGASGERVLREGEKGLSAKEIVKKRVDEDRQRAMVDLQG